MTSLFSGIGVDLSDHHLRLAHVSWFDRILHLHQVNLPDGLVLQGRVTELEALRAVFVRALDDLGVGEKHHRITLLVPDALVETKIFFLEKRLNKRALHTTWMDSICESEHEFCNNCVVCFSQGAKEPDGVRTTGYSVHKNIMRTLVGMVPKERCRVVNIETNTKAILRLYQVYAKHSARAKRFSEPVALVDIANTSVTVNIYTRVGSSLIAHTQPYTSKEKLIPRLVETLREMQAGIPSHAKLKLIALVGVRGQDEEILSALQSDFLDDCHVKFISDTLRVAGKARTHMPAYGASIGAALRATHRRKFTYQHNFLDAFEDVENFPFLHR